MKRAFVALFLFLAFFLFETSFVASLPSPIRLSPIVFAMAVYLLQHQLSPVGAWWLVAQGVMLDLFQIGSVPFETIPYAGAAIAGILVSRHVFSNRSYYGVAGCVVAAWSVLGLLRTVQIGIRYLQNAELGTFSLFFREWGIGLILALLCAWALFAVSARVRIVLGKSFLIPPSSRQTY